MMQPDLFSAKRAPTVDEQDVAVLLIALDQRGWMNARELTRLGYGSDRYLRAVAAASHGQIISGQRGYARTDQASVEDVNHAAAWLEHQATAMTQRAYEIRRAMHRRIA